MSTDALTVPSDLVRSPFLDLPGAVAGTGVDAGIAAHYGNPLSEQRRLAENGAIVDLSSHSVLSISGPDRLSWIDSLTSQSVAKLQPGESAETLQLDPNGRLEYVLRIVDDGDTAWILTEQADAAPLLAWLTRMRFMLRVELADRSSEFATVGSFGTDLLEPASPNGVPLVWRDPWHEMAAGGFSYASNESHPSAEWTWTETLIERSRLEALAAAAAAGNLPVAGALAYDALRIAAWRPRAAFDADDRTIPHELDWLRSAVHLSKGCYRGQETVAKVLNLGRPPRRLVMLHLDGSEAILPVHGDVVMGQRGDEPVEVGTVTSSAIHYELGPIALAVVKRSADPAAVLTVLSDNAKIAAGQEIIVPAGAGPTVEVPRLPRLGQVAGR